MKARLQIVRTLDVGFLPLRSRGLLIVGRRASAFLGDSSLLIRRLRGPKKWKHVELTNMCRVSCSHMTPQTDVLVFQSLILADTLRHVCDSKRGRYMDVHE
jgi:hypothetical protein